MAMSCTWPKTWPLLLFMWLLLAPTRGLALPPGMPPPMAPIADPATLCQAALGLAEQVARTPPGLLGAIARVESGRRDPATRLVSPWPWTIDANGTGHAYPTEAAAIAAAEQFQLQGIASLDIGCMQINLQQHPNAFATLAQAFDPAANTLYGARFLRRLKEKLGGWNQAIAGYHSQTPALGQPYARKVLAVWHGGAVPPTLPAMTTLAAATPAKTRPAKPSAGAIALRRYGLGGFAFSGLHGAPKIIPAAMQSVAGVPGTVAIAGRALAAYRSTPISISGAR